MNVAFFIAKRIAFNNRRSFSRFIIRLAIAATALSVAAMIITISFVNGFQQAVSNKVFSFWGHLRVQQYNPGQSVVSEETPIERNDTVLHVLHSTPGIKQVQAYATKSAVIEFNKEIDGVLFKGVAANYDFTNLQPFLKQGNWLNFRDTLYSKDIVISKSLADELKIQLNDSIHVYFISAENKSTKVRKLHVCGIYKTGMEEYDKLYVIGDIRLLRRINNWNNGEIGGYEIFLNNSNTMDTISELLQHTLPLAWYSKTLKEVQPNIFDWLNIQDVNRNVIFIVMGIVAVINLITCLLILVLERTPMVGILKAVGATDGAIQQVFLYHAAIIAAAGIVLGLLFGLGVCLLQQYTGFIHLNESAYYVSSAPVQIVWWQVLLVCICTMAVCFLSLALPTFIVKTVRPVKAIGFR